MGQYNKNKVPVRPPIKSIHLEVHWIDSGGGQAIKSFDNVQELAWFLHDNSDLAKAVGYEPKPLK